MRFEDFTDRMKDMVLIPDYVLFQALGGGQSAINLAHRWCDEGRLVRLKKGLYVLSSRYKKHPTHLLFQIANNLVSPSYISLDTALSYYGLIPEGVVEIQSVCFKRAKKFENGLGRFSYRKLERHAYPPGIIISGEGEGNFLIASKEKAILDKIYFFNSERCFNVDYLIESLRIEEDDLKGLRFNLLEEYANAYPTKKMQAVAKKLRRYYGS